MKQQLSHKTIRAGNWDGPHETVELTYDARFLRRKVLTTTTGTRFLVDLEHTTSLDHGDAFELENGALVEVIAAQEDLLEVTGEGLVRIAWHIGNRHTPCQIEATRLVIQSDKVIDSMLRQIGASTRPICEPFTPEGGAYGHGRTHGHDHSATHSHHEHDHADHAH